MPRQFDSAADSDDDIPADKGGDMKAHICNAAGCFSIVPTANTYCARHQSQQVEKDQRKKVHEAARSTATWAKYHAHNPEQQKVWASARWKKLRAEHLQREPLCRACGAIATSVDHIIAHRGDPDFAYNPDNLQSLCSACHGRKTRAERAKP